MFLRILTLVALCPCMVVGQQPIDTSRGDAMLADYFQLRTTALENRYLEGIATKEDWLEKRSEYVQQLQDCLLYTSPSPRD